jgi:hypothetical protein
MRKGAHSPPSAHQPNYGQYPAQQAAPAYPQQAAPAYPQQAAPVYPQQAAPVYPKQAAPAYPQQPYPQQPYPQQPYPQQPYPQQQQQESAEQDNDSQRSTGYNWKRQAMDMQMGTFGGDHIESPGACTDFGEVRAGDQMTTRAFYDMTIHKGMTHKGEEEKVMGNMRVFIGRTD